MALRWERLTQRLRTGGVWKADGVGALTNLTAPPKAGEGGQVTLEQGLVGRHCYTDIR